MLDLDQPLEGTATVDARGIGPGLVVLVEGRVGFSGTISSLTAGSNGAPRRTVEQALNDLYERSIP